MRRATPVLAVAALLFMLLPAPPAAAADIPGSLGQDERQVTVPDGKGTVPAYRTVSPTLLVCKTDRADFDKRTATFPAELKAGDFALWTQCQTGGYRNLQDAVNAVKDAGVTIKILPGVYLEEPSLATPAGACAGLPRVLSWEQQVQCPHQQNLVAVLDKKDLQIEGTGATPEDVVIDAQYRRSNGLRADRSSGIYLRNFTTQRTTMNAVYVVEADGFVVDNVIGRWNGGYGFLSYAIDHGVYADCAAYGNSAAGIAAASTSDLNVGARNAVDRYAVEIRGCTSHDNLIGYSGPAGDSVWAHDNAFSHNATGVATGATRAEGPQNHALFETNVIADNNQGYYQFIRDGTCARPLAQRGYDKGVVCPGLGVPPGTGVLNPGGNYNTWRGNWVYGNAYAGFVTSWVPGVLRGDRALRAQFDTANGNRYYANNMGVSVQGARSPNGMDFWWDGQGVGSCWQRPSWDGAEPRSLPACGNGDLPAKFGTARYLAEPGKTLKLYVCSQYTEAAKGIPADCDWFGAKGFARVEVKWALGEAILLGLVLLFLWWRLLGGSTAAFTGLASALGGLVVGVYGTLNETTPLSAIGLGLVGFGWLLVGVALRRRGRSGLGWLTILIGIFALLGGVDQGLLILPWIPTPPSVPRILLEVLWVPCALVATARGRMLAVSRPRSRRGDFDPLDQYTAHLWE